LGHFLERGTRKGGLFAAVATQAREEPGSDRRVGGDGGAALGLGFGVHKLVLHQRSSTQTAKQSASDDSVLAYSDAASFACE